MPKLIERLIGVDVDLSQYHLAQLNENHDLCHRILCGTSAHNINAVLALDFEKWRSIFVQNFNREYDYSCAITNREIMSRDEIQIMADRGYADLAFLRTKFGDDIDYIKMFKNAPFIIGKPLDGLMDCFELHNIHIVAMFKNEYMNDIEFIDNCMKISRSAETVSILHDLLDSAKLQRPIAYRLIKMFRNLKSKEDAMKIMFEHLHNAKQMLSKKEIKDKYKPAKEILYLASKFEFAIYDTHQKWRSNIPPEINLIYNSMTDGAKSRCAKVNSRVPTSILTHFICKLISVIKYSMTFEPDYVVEYLPKFIIKYFPQYATHCANITPITKYAHLVPNDFIIFPELEIIAAKHIKISPNTRIELLDAYARSQQIVYLLYHKDRSVDVDTMLAELFPQKRTHTWNECIDILIREYPKIALICLISAPEKYAELYSYLDNLVGADITVFDGDNELIVNYFKHCDNIAA
jgi:hypothetical protein